MSQTRVVILGAGAMGCLYAAKLLENPAVAVTLVTHRAAQAEFLNRNGLSFTEGGVTRQLPLCAVESGTPLLAPDVVLVFVKAQQTASAVENNRRLLGDHTVVGSLQNGLGGQLVLSRQVAPERLVVGVSNHNSTVLAPGQILHAASGETRIGALNTPEITPAVRRVADLFAPTTLNITPDSDIKRAIWRKLLVNLVINPLTCLKQQPNGFIAQDFECRILAEKLLAEAVPVAAAEGVIFDKAEILAHVLAVSSATSQGRSSMWQDRLAGRKTEIDFINGAVVALAQQHHLAAPLNAELVAQIHALEV